MNINPFITSIASSILAKLLETLVKIELDRLEKTHPLKKAISRTDKEFEKIEDLPNILESWLKNEKIKKELDEFSKGKRSISIKTLAKTLVEKADFYHGDESIAKGKEIIERFFEILNEEYLQSIEGLVHLDHREETRAKKNFESHKKTQKAIEGLRLDVSEIKTSLLQTAQADKWKGKYEDQFTKRIDEAKDLLNQGKAKTAKKLYERLLDEISQEKEISVTIRFRIYTNLACSEWELGFEKDAAKYFELAHELLPNDKKGLANMGIARMFQGKANEGLKYVEKALDEEPLNIHAVCVKADLLTVLKDYDEAIDLFKHKKKKGFNRELLNNAQCSFTIGLVFYKKDDFENSRKYFKKAVQLDPSAADYFLLLAESILRPIVSMNSLPWLISTSEKKDLRRVEKYYTQALELLRNSENNQKIANLLVNRSAIRIGLNNLDESIDDSTKAIITDPDKPIAYRNKGIAEVQLKKYDKAISSWLKAIEKGDNLVVVLTLIANAYISKKPAEPKKAIKIIKKHFLDEEVNEENLLLMITLSECYIANKQYSKAENKLKNLQKGFPNNPRIFMALARCNWAKGEIERTESYFKKALQSVNNFEKQLVLLDLSNYYLEQKLYDKAIIYYKQIVNPNIVNNTLNNYLICLYNSSNKREAYPECLDICSNIRRKSGVTKVISEIEATIEEELGNLENARNLYSKLAKIEPEKYMHRLRHAVCEFRIGNQQKAIKILSEIKDKIKGDADALMTIAEIFDFVGIRSDSIVIGYKALKAAPNDPKIHLAYMRIFLSRDESEWLAPEAIEKDTWVKFKVNGDERCYILVDSEKTAKNEISVEGKIGMKLLDHKVGDEIKIGKAPLSDQKIKILGIKSKYVEAFHDSIKNFNTRFLRENGMLQIKPGKDLKNLFKMLDEDAKRLVQVTEFYKQSKFPIGSVSHLLGKTLFDCWGGLIATPDLNLRCATGTVQEQMEEAEIVESTSDVIVDTIGLFTLALLDFLDVFPKLFQNIYVVQSTLDKVNQSISSLELGKKRGRTTIGKYKGEYRRWEISPKTVQKEIDFLKKIKYFIVKQSKVTGFKIPLSSSDKRLREMIGEPSLDSIVVAKGNKLALYSDDKSLRDLAFVGYRIKGFCINALLSEALNQNKISKEEYSKAIVTLILNRYTFIPVNGEALYYAAKKNNFNSTSKETTLLFKTMKSPNTRLNSTLNVLSDFIKLIWLESLLPTTKFSYLDISLKTITKERGIRSVLGKFKKYIKVKLHLDPIHRDEIVRNINAWERGQLLIY